MTNSPIQSENERIANQMRLKYGLSLTNTAEIKEALDTLSEAKDREIAAKDAEILRLATKNHDLETDLSDKDALIEDLKGKLREAESKLGCDHLDGPYRRLLEEKASLITLLRKAGEALKPFAGSYAVNPCSHVDVFPDDMDKAQQTLEEIKKVTH